MKKKQTPVVLLSIVVVLVGGAVIMNSAIPNTQQQASPDSVVQQEMTQVDLKNPNRVLQNPEAPGQEMLSQLATHNRGATYIDPNEKSVASTQSVVMNKHQKEAMAKRPRPDVAVGSLSLQEKSQAGQHPK